MSRVSGGTDDDDGSDTDSPAGALSRGSVTVTCSLDGGVKLSGRAAL